MKYILKRFWPLLIFALFVSIPLFITGVIRTDYTLTLKGDTTLITSFLDLEGQYTESGTFSSIYVISMDHSTVFQNFVVDHSVIPDKSKMGTYTVNLTSEESNVIGSIQKQSSIANSIILAYKTAQQTRTEIVIDYHCSDIRVTYYNNKCPFRPGDKIVDCDDHNILDDFDGFRTSFNARADNDSCKIGYYHNDEYKTVELTSDNVCSFGFEQMYYIDYDTLFPQIEVMRTNTGGPSAGFLQTLSVYNRLIPEDLTMGLNIAGTGTISLDGHIGAIGGIKQKVATAIDNNIDIFFCPKENEDDGRLAYDSISNKHGMKFVVVANFSEAVNYLRSAYNEI